MPRERKDSTEIMDALIDGVEELHSSPVVACRVLELLKDSEFQVGDVEQYLEADPALAAAVLRLVNSSLFGLSRKIASLHEAVTYLGARSLRLAVLSFGLVDRLTRGTPAKVCEDYWRRALTMAAAASRLCRNQNAVPSDEAYSAGLLADVGALVFAQAKTDRYVTLYEKHGHGRRLVEEERRQLGFGHPDLGARLLSRWNLPEQLTLATACHHDDYTHGNLLYLAVLAGDMLADVLWTPETPRLPVVQRLLASEFGLNLDGFISLAVECKRDISDATKLFRVELAGSIDCQALLKHAMRRYKTEAMETAMDWDSVTAILGQDEPALEKPCRDQSARSR